MANTSSTAAVALTPEQEGLNIRKVLTCWYQKASKRKRCEFLKSIFSKDAVEVKDKAQLKECIDLWLENLITEVRPGSEDVSNQSRK